MMPRSAVATKSQRLGAHGDLGERVSHAGILYGVVFHALYK